jgi:hypothetical protein
MIGLSIASHYDMDIHISRFDQPIRKVNIIGYNQPSAYHPLHDTTAIGVAGSERVELSARQRQWRLLLWQSSTAHVPRAGHASDVFR